MKVQIRPKVAVDPDGRITIFVGCYCETMKLQAARSLRDQLSDAIEHADIANSRPDNLDLFQPSVVP